MRNGGLLVDADKKIKRRKLIIASFHIISSIALYILTAVLVGILLFSLEPPFSLRKMLSILILLWVALFMLYAAYKTTKNAFIFVQGKISVIEGYLYHNDKACFKGYSEMRGTIGLGFFRGKTVITKDFLDRKERNTIYRNPNKLMTFEWWYIWKPGLFSFGEHIRLYYYSGTNILCYIETVSHKQ